MFRSRSQGDLHTGSAVLLGWPSTLSLRMIRLFAQAVRVVCHASLLRSVVRIHPPAADEIVHGSSDGIRLLDDHEMPGARDIDDLHSLTQLIPLRVSVGGRGGYVIETLNHQ